MATTMSGADSERRLWPPGTVRLEDITHLGRNHPEIILVPRPTTDPNDPLNWKRWEKTLNFSLVLLYALIIFALIAAATPTWAPMNEELGFSYTILNDSYATGSATLCIGALIFIPFAQRYGRRPIYIISLALQVAVSVWAAKLQTVADLLLVNAFNCLLGALAEVIIQMTVADIYFVHERGFMNSIYVWVMYFSSSLSPLVAGYITVGQGWRWVWWWFVIIIGVSFLLFTFLYEETKFTPEIDGASSQATPIDSSPAASDSFDKEKIAMEKISYEQSTVKMDRSLSPSMAQPRSRKTYLQRLSLLTSSPGSLKDMLYHSYQPLLLLVTIPTVAYTAILYGLVTAIYQMSITVVATYMPVAPYNFNAAQIGLMSLPGFIGTSLGSLLSAPLSDRIILWLAKRNGGIYEPEMRLWLSFIFALFMPAGLLMFGYSLQNGASWVLVAVGIGMFSFGMTPISSVTLTYLTDSYTKIVGDAVVGVVFVRNAFATAFIFALPPWEAKTGLGTIFLVLATIAVIVVLGNIGFLIYGKRMRVFTAKRHELLSARQLDTRTTSSEQK